MVLSLGKYHFIMEACLIGNIKHLPHVVPLNTHAVSILFSIFCSISIPYRSPIDLAVTVTLPSDGN